VKININQQTTNRQA